MLSVCLSVCNASVLWQNFRSYDHVGLIKIYPNALTLCLPSLMDEIRRDFLRPGAQTGVGWFLIDLLRDAIFRKRYEIELRWQLITHRKSYMGFRLALGYTSAICIFCLTTKLKKRISSNFKHNFGLTCRLLCVTSVYCDETTAYRIVRSSPQSS